MAYIFFGNFSGQDLNFRRGDGIRALSLIRYPAGHRKILIKLVSIIIIPEKAIIVCKEIFLSSKNANTGGPRAVLNTIMVLK